MKVIKKFLKKVIDGDLSVVKEDVFGLCYNLEDYLSDHGINSINAYDFIMVKSIGWEHHTGNEKYPVKDYIYSLSIWEGEQLKLRQSLCKHILDNME